MRDRTFVICIEGRTQLAIKASFELVYVGIYLDIQYVNFVIKDGHLPKRTKCGVDNYVSNPSFCLFG